MMNILIIILTTIISALCSEPDVKILKYFGNFSANMEFVFNDKTEIVLVFPTVNKTWPFRIKTESNASWESPVLVVVQQQMQVLSWSVPLLANSSDSVGFRTVSRTLCDQNLTKPSVPSFKEEFTVILYSYSSDEVSISVRVEETPNFYAGNQQIVTTVSPSEPQFFFYKVNTASKTILVDISSNDSACIIASIQRKRCPVFDLNQNIKYDGTFQTIDIKGGMRIRTVDYKDGFFLVFVATNDNDVCNKKTIWPPSTKLFLHNSPRSTIFFTISPGTSEKDYVVATLSVLGILAAFVIFAISLVCLFNNCGRIQQPNEENDRLIQEPTTSSINSPEESENFDSLAEIPENLLILDHLTKSQETPRKSYNYLYHIWSIGLFYAIPVVQLVFTYQRVMRKSGDEDLCYYNFLCANPVWLFDDFNHVFSNIGYIITGLLFLAVVYRRSRAPQIGFQVHYGIFYALGSALIIEGLLSACYHVCPNQSNFQFDTSFMYVMAVLCMVKLYQNRHSDISASAYTTFGVLGGIILISMMGILDDNQHKEVSWTVFLLLHLFMCIFLSIKIYYLSPNSFATFWNNLRTDGITRNSLRPKRFILLLIANIVNYSLLAAVFFFDFGTFILVILMGNVVLYSITYIIMKCISKERPSPAAITYGLLAIISWGFAVFFFMHHGTSWMVSPAQSRHWNQHCQVLNFYDTHDIWHLLSSIALYFSFMFLLCIDDNLNKQKINVF